MRTNFGIVIVMAVFIFLSCSKGTPASGGTDDTAADPVTGGGTGTPSNGWCIPSERVIDGGPGKDGIPALTNPAFVIADEVSFLTDDDLVVGYRKGSDIRAYGHNILNWHEIVNDEVSGDKLAIIYCPLTGTATAWNRVIPGGETTFGVSGLLYNTNVIPYDRLTNSNWSQLLQKSVNGKLINTEAEDFQVIETTWKTWRSMYPKSKVLSTKTGFGRNYDAYPYRDYRTNDNALLFNIIPDDRRIPRKERVIGVVIDGEVKVYRFSSLPQEKGVGSNVFYGKGIIKDVFKGQQIIIVGDEKRNILVAFENTLSSGRLGNYVYSDLPNGILTDQSGNVWDIFGVAISGPLRGQRLKSPQFIVGYWMAFGSFFPNATIY